MKKEEKSREEIRRQITEVCLDLLACGHCYDGDENDDIDKIMKTIDQALSQREAEVREEMWKKLEKCDSKLIEWDEEDKKTYTLTRVFRLRDIGDILGRLSQPKNQK